MPAFKAARWIWAPMKRRRFDVTLSKSASPRPPMRATPLRMPLPSPNNGTAIATDVTITDSVPVSASPGRERGRQQWGSYHPHRHCPNFAWQVTDSPHAKGHHHPHRRVETRPAGVFTNSAPKSPPPTMATWPSIPASPPSWSRSTNAGLVSLVLSSGH